MLAWKFICSDHKLRFKDGREVKVGETLTDPLDVHGQIITTPTLCESGFHASFRARDALRYAAHGMTHVARVEIDGTVVSGKDKTCGTVLRVLWMADATKTLRLFAIACRWRQMSFRLQGREPSLAALWALDVAERFVNGEADDDERIAAAAAADAAAAAYAAHAAHAAYDAAAHADAAAATDAAYAAYAAHDAAAVYDAAAAADAAAAVYDAAAADAAELETALEALKPRKINP